MPRDIDEGGKAQAVLAVLLFASLTVLFYLFHSGSMLPPFLYQGSVLLLVLAMIDDSTLRA